MQRERKLKLQEEFLGVQRSPSSKDIDKMEGGGNARRASGGEDAMVKDKDVNYSEFAEGKL